MTDQTTGAEPNQTPAARRWIMRCFDVGQVTSASMSATPGSCLQRVGTSVVSASISPAAFGV
jgi:hypothetical protein